MHAIETPQLPRISVLALGAILLAIVVLLIAASRVADIGGSSGFSSGAATAPAAVASVRTATSPWSANPFASPFHVVAPWTTATRR